MLTDTFFNRYQDVSIWTAFTELDRRFLSQAAQIIADEIYPRNERSYKEKKHDPAMIALEAVFSKLAREVGVNHLTKQTYPHSWTIPQTGQTVTHNYQWAADRKVKNFLQDTFKENYSPDWFMKLRVSFIELVMQQRANELEALSSSGASTTARHAQIQNTQGVFQRQVFELNERLRQARIPISFHNKLIQVSDDKLLEQRIERPFWHLVAAPKWANVDQQMKEALDARDRGDRNAISNAFNALESTIKTISDEKQWTMGTERGAAAYISNLAKDRDGNRFVERWEEDALIKLFSSIRNVFGHGPTSGQPLPMLSPQQTEWVIETCMVWIKSLVSRA